MILVGNLSPEDQLFREKARMEVVNDGAVVCMQPGFLGKGLTDSTVVYHSWKHTQLMKRMWGGRFDHQYYIN